MIRYLTGATGDYLESTGNRRGWDVFVPAYDGNDVAETFKRADAALNAPKATAASPLTDEQIVKIARGEATLRGYSRPGLTYHEGTEDEVGEYDPAKHDPRPRPEGSAS